jgi:biopolymer transport protein ExbD
MARPIPEINAGSMADIAFLLLIFFLVTTTMDVDSGIIRRLPPPVPPDQEKQEVKQRNTFVVLVNSADMLLVNNTPGDIRTLRTEAKDFLKLRNVDDPNYPEIKEKEIENLGKINVSKGIISLQNDRGTSYDMYIQVQNELAAAIRELRDEFAKERFGQPYAKLPEAYAKAVSEAIPVAISEAEPVDIESTRKK